MSSNIKTLQCKKQAVIVQWNKIEPDDSASLIGETIDMESIVDEWSMHKKKKDNSTIPSIVKN